MTVYIVFFTLNGFAWNIQWFCSNQTATSRMRMPNYVQQNCVKMISSTTACNQQLHQSTGNNIHQCSGLQISIMMQESRARPSSETRSKFSVYFSHLFFMLLYSNWPLRLWPFCSSAHVQRVTRSKLLQVISCITACWYWRSRTQWLGQRSFQGKWLG